MALADNATVKVDLQWDTEQLESVAEDFGINTDEWGVENFSQLDIDDFFNDEQGEIKDKDLKLQVIIPSSMSDKLEEIRLVITEVLTPYNGIKIQ